VLLRLLGSWRPRHERHTSVVVVFLTQIGGVAEGSVFLRGVFWIVAILTPVVLYVDVSPRPEIFHSTALAHIVPLPVLQIQQACEVSSILHRPLQLVVYSQLLLQTNERPELARPLQVPVGAVPEDGPQGGLCWYVQVRDDVPVVLVQVVAPGPGAHPHGGLLAVEHIGRVLVVGHVQDAVASGEGEARREEGHSHRLVAGRPPHGVHVVLYVASNTPHHTTRFACMHTYMNEWYVTHDEIVEWKVASSELLCIHYIAAQYSTIP
jgi:hypothetical protein